MFDRDDKEQNIQRFSETLNVKTTGGPPTKLSLDVDPEVKHSFKAEISLAWVPQATLPDITRLCCFFVTLQEDMIYVDTSLA